MQEVVASGRRRRPRAARGGDGDVGAGAGVEEQRSSLAALEKNGGWGEISQVFGYIGKALVPVRGTNRDQCPPLVPVGATNRDQKPPPFELLKIGLWSRLVGPAGTKGGHWSRFVPRTMTNAPFSPGWCHQPGPKACACQSRGAVGCLVPPR